VDLIYTHPSGGELWQGGSHDVRELVDGRRPQKVHTIVLSAQEEIPKLHVPKDRFEVVEAPLIDSYDLDAEAIALTAGLADMGATELANALRRGKFALSACAAGRNRSGLISALALMKVASMKPGPAVALIRRKRRGADGPALSNELFVEILFALRDTVGSMATWKRWKSRSH
jgi:protein-tyrosine phosphatase